LNWFHELTHNPHIDVALLVDSLGKLVATSNRIGREAQRVASMIKAAEVLARGLSAELGRGEVRSLQVTTQNGHVLVLPAGPTHYLIILLNREAPMELILNYVQRLIDHMKDDNLDISLEPSESLDDLDVNELIEAVSEWLHAGGDRRHRR
jgi:predicted regulator of Ras-like GTPase activity (Roadblock/LC7/MglB family)